MQYQVQVKAGNLDWSDCLIAKSMGNGVFHSNGELAIFNSMLDAQVDVSRRELEFNRAFPNGHSAQHRIVKISG